MGLPKRNRLLSALSDDERQTLQPFLASVKLSEKTEIYPADRPMTRLYFLEEGLASVVTPKGRATAVGLVGREGFLGAPIVLGTFSHPFVTTMQTEGTALALEAGDLPAAFAAAPRLEQLLTRFIAAEMVQLAQLALCSGTHSVRQRLARWLLTAADRLERNTLALTQEFLSDMLCVRRPSISGTIKVLEQSGAIHQGHARILIVNRDELRAQSCDCHAIIEAEYRRCIDSFDLPRHEPHARR